MSSPVLIAAAEHLASLQQRDDLSGATTFSDSEARQALDFISRQRPHVVVLERLFAASSRGAALINRIKADPALVSCEIRIVAHDSSDPPVVARRVEPVAQEPPPPPPPAAPVPAPGASLDQRGTRRVPRFKMLDGVDVQVDGNPATLVDLSVAGAQLLSPSALRPNQRIRLVLALPDPARPIRTAATVAWAAFEIPREGARYRAGLEFVDPDTEALQQFIDLNKRPTV